MKRKRICSFFIILSLILGLFVTQGKSVKAGAPSGIAGNGTGGIFIDINAAPYIDYANIPNWGKYAYGTAGCAWFASARVNQLTGANCTIYSGKSWYNSAYASFGFSRGNEFRAKALACYENHVAVVESVSGNTAVVSEGGYTSVSSLNGYCVIHTLSKAELESARGGGFLGYVYLAGDAPQPAGSLSYSNLHTTFIDTWNAGLYGYINNPGKMTVSEVGVWVWDSAGTLVVDHKERCGLKTSYVEQQLNIVGEALPSGLKSGETYTYQMYAVANGVVYKSDIGTFTILDNEKPKVSNIKISDVSSDGYTVSCTVTDNYQVARVQFPVWTDANGQDDLQKDWTTSSKSSGIKIGDTYTFRVNISDHNNESGVYHTHIYAWDKYGNQTDAFVAPKTYVPEKGVETSKPIADRTPEPIASEKPKPIIVETSEPVISVTPEPIIIETPEPVISVTPEPIISETAEPIMQVTPKPTTKPTVSAPDKVVLYKPYSLKKKTMRVDWYIYQYSYFEGFQLQYATNKRFKSTKNVAVSRGSDSKTIKKLKSGKRYYVRIRAYKFFGGKKIYGKWSAVKNCKIK